MRVFTFTEEENLRIVKVIISSIFIFLFSTLSLATTLENIPLDSWVYPAIEELYTQGLFTKLHKNNKPYTRGKISSELKKIKSRVEKLDLVLTRTQSWLLEKLYQEFENELKTQNYPFEKNEPKKIKASLNPFIYLVQNKNDSSYARGKLVMSAAFQWKSFLFKNRFIIDTKAEKEKNLFGQEWKNGLSGIFDSGYLKGDFKHFEFQWGRDYLRWGPGAKDYLLLSGFSPPFDMLKLTGELGIFRFEFFATALDEFKSLDSNFYAKRYLSGHRINLRLKSGFEFGLSEVVLYGGEKRSLEPYYLNPLFVFYAEQFNRNIDDNLLWSIDLSVTHFKNRELYTEILIDDFQYDFKSEPQQIGFLLGFKSAETFGLSGNYFTFEYTRINNWVYGQNKPWNIYTYHDVGMGSFLGPDADLVYLNLLHHLTKNFQLSFSLKSGRKGEGEIGLQPSPVPKTRKFPSGIVERTNNFILQGIFQPNAYLYLEGEFGYTSINNHLNLLDKKERNVFFNLRLTYNLWKECWF
ncbi:MAG: capsule assembly Wzi family protein [candidate division Zixibacteria bacterium]|nr:capsule assembly Wzi family protein [candidate division Zixibacteria bacterium]